MCKCGVKKKKMGRARRSQKRLNTHNSNMLRKQSIQINLLLMFMFAVDVWRAPKLVRVCLTGTRVVTTRVHVDPATRTRVGGWLFVSLQIADGRTTLLQADGA